MEQYKKDFITFMVRSQVLTFGDFVTKSGRKTPFFINTGNYRTGQQIALLGEFYAQAIRANIGSDFDVLYGPAYKGIPLAVATVIALATKYNHSVPYCFNRKEAKDHGEGGLLIGHKVANNDRVVIIDDVTTAGTSVRESVALLTAAANVTCSALVVSVDRMEKGTGEKSALDEIRTAYGMKAFAIVTLDDIIACLYNTPVDNKIIVDDAMKTRIDAYRKLYGVQRN